MDELSAVFEKGERGPNVETENRIGSFGVVVPDASCTWLTLDEPVAFELDGTEDVPVSAEEEVTVPYKKAGLLALAEP
jgi:hypothetical protein